MDNNLRLIRVVCWSKDDMIRASEFVFGANLKEMLIENPKNLLHKALWKEYDAGREIQCFVEVTINLISDNETLKLYRGIENCKVQYKINDKVVSILYYEEQLNSLNLNIKRKNIILRKSLFNYVIWGTPEDLEMVVTNIMRVNSRAKEWEKARMKIKDLREAKSLATYEKSLQKMKKSHGTVEKFVDHFNNFTMKRNYFRKFVSEEASVELLKQPQTSTRLQKTVTKEIMSQEHLGMLQDKHESLLDIYKTLEIRENELSWKMYQYEVKISSNPLKTGILQERIITLKAKFKEYEEFLSSLWTGIKELDYRLQEIDFEISDSLATLWDLGKSYYLENRLTTYGRLVDHIKPSIYIQLLGKILGESILYGNLCDDTETAILCSQHLRDIKYEGRETFIIFENYSSEFKDLMLASDEGSINIDSINELVIFLCKLKQYGLITTVPVVVAKAFNFEQEEGIYYASDIIYPQDGIFFHSDGVMSYYCDSKTDVETEITVDRTNQLMIEQELIYEEYRALVFQRFETIQKMIYLENDILHLKLKLKTHKPSFYTVSQKLPLLDIYSEYLSIFEEHERDMELTQEDLIKSEEFISEGILGIKPELDNRTCAQIEDALKNLQIALNTTKEEKAKVKDELMRKEKELRLSQVYSNKVWFPPVRRYILWQQPKQICSFYYEMELEKIRALMTLDEINEFESWKDWRIETINSMVKDIRNDASLLRTLKKEMDDLATIRKRLLAPLLEHCNVYLSSAINVRLIVRKTRYILLDEFLKLKPVLICKKEVYSSFFKTSKSILKELITDASLPFLHLEMAENGLQLLSSLSRNTVNITEIGHLNTFLKFVVCLSLFLEIANFDRIPLLLLDNLEEFLPKHSDSYAAILGDNTLNRVLSSNENINFQILSRISHYLDLFIKKNTPRPNVKKNGKKGSYGPVQIIYFTSEDLVHAAQHHLWIKHSLLPDEYINEECDSYSMIEEIKFEC